MLFSKSAVAWAHRFTFSFRERSALVRGIKSAASAPLVFTRRGIYRPGQQSTSSLKHADPSSRHITLFNRPVSLDVRICGPGGDHSDSPHSVKATRRRCRSSRPSHQVRHSRRVCAARRPFLESIVAKKACRPNQISPILLKGRFFSVFLIIGSENNGPRFSTRCSCLRRPEDYLPRGS
jgi:hypothetical protein